MSEISATEKTVLGTSGRRTVTQGEVDAFAELTGDCQWIRTDPHRAAASPFGGTIAHGYLTLSLIPALLDEVFRLDQYAAVLARMLGVHIDVAVQSQRASSGDWTRYAAGVSHRNESAP